MMITLLEPASGGSRVASVCRLAQVVDWKWSELNEPSSDDQREEKDASRSYFNLSSIINTWHQ